MGDKMTSFQETFIVGGSVIYGRADDRNRIIELLSSEDGDNLNPPIVSIVADRGTGRTTMLHLLHSELCNTFDLRKFICMPEKFDEKGLMRVIIESLTAIPCDITDLEILEEMVKEELMDKRLLLLLDNFESKNQKCWDLLSALLKVCGKTSAVVVTTTRKAIAEVKGPMQFYYMNNLSNRSCWMIFTQCAFTGQNPNANTELADVGKCLVAKCKNITLCIKVLSGVLRHSITNDWWRAVLDSSFWEMNEVRGDMMPALRVCYELLPSHLKQCFKYCSLFPKEYIFSRQHLVRVWLSQGFIKPDEAREVEDIGLEYFDQLLSRSFFEPSPIHDMKEDKFVMSGLIHDLAQQLSKNECFQFEGGVQRVPENARHLSLVPHEFQSVTVNQLIKKAQNLQTFLVVSRSEFQHQSISSSILNFVEMEDLFSKFHSLTTLDLNYTDIEELPESFWSLINLCYLGVRSTKIKRVPFEISNLIHLQTLDAKDCHYLEELPRTIEALTNLRYLDVTKELGYVVMPRGIGKLTNMRSLATFSIGMDPLLHCGIEELKHMEHLRGCIEISGLVNVSSEIDAKEAHMRSKEHIDTLFLHWSDGNTFLEEEEEEEEEEGVEIAEKVLQSLHPTDNLNEMVIRDYPGKMFPMWIECATFSRLASITFDHCYNCVGLPDLGGLPLLKFLSIQKMYCVQRMDLSGSGNAPENSTRYPSLEKLIIWEMYGLVEWVEIGNLDFPVLHSLCINKCPLLRNIPKFRALVELSVYSCAQFLEDMDLPSLQSLRIEGLQKTKSVRLPKNRVGLKKLEISHCPKLSSIEGLSLVNSLETIIVVRCPKLDFQDILELQDSLLKREGNTSVSSRGKELDFSGSDLLDEEQKHPIISNERKRTDDRSSLSGGLAEGHKKFEVLESQMSKQDQRVGTTGQSSIANLTPSMATTVGSEILDSDSPLIPHSELSSFVDSLTEPASGSSITWDLRSEWSEHLEVSRERTAFMKLEEYQTPKAALEESAALVPSDNRFTNPIKEYDERIAGADPSRSLWYKIVGRVGSFLYRKKHKAVDVSSSSDKLQPATPHRVPTTPSRFEMSSQLSQVGSVQLTINQIIKATHNFSDALKLGEGWFGTGYKALLPDGRVFAVKRIKKEHLQGPRDEFNNELDFLAKIDHKNLVRLLGYIDTGNGLILITEYVSNGNLREHLDGLRGKTLDFGQRLEIAIDVAHGLTYLHLYAEKPILHQHVKSSNILLTESFRAKVADFGFARTGPTEPDQSQIETDVRGTAGYLDPEYLKSNQLTLKSDVFSFGILLLEILSARRPVEVNRSRTERITVRWAFDNYSKGHVSEIKDPMLQEEIDDGVLNKYFCLAFQCAAPTRTDRPVMKEVVEQLWKIRKEYTRSRRRV